MSEETYKEFLKTAPEDHLSDEFIQFLRDNNEVDYNGFYWLVIKNKKYWTPENDWMTAFYVGKDRNTPYIEVERMKGLFMSYKDREILIKAPHKRTVKLFHVHLIKKQ